MRKIRYATGILLLIFTWIFLFYILTLFTEFTLAPWDTAVERPPFGVWQRTLNDFFETSPGQFSIATIVVLASIFLVYRTARRSPEQIFPLALTNIAYIVVVIPVYLLTSEFNNWLPYPPVLYDPTYIGYHRSIVPAVVVLGITVLWLIYQRRASHLATYHLAVAA